MRKFSVSPDGLRSTALVVSCAADATEPVTNVAHSDNLGHAGLQSAVAEYMQALSGGWSEAVEQVEAASSTLKTTADLYEGADADGSGDLRGVEESI